MFCSVFLKCLTVWPKLTWQVELTRSACLKNNGTVLTSLIFQLSEFSYLDMLFVFQAVKTSWCDGQRQA